jgi:hypothetical protein
MSVDLKSPTVVALFEEGRLDKLFRKSYGKAHPGESFEDLKRRARFDKHEKALLVDWLARQLALFLSRLDRM